MNIEYKDKDVEISIKNISNNDVSKEDYEYVMKIIELLKGFSTPFKETFLPTTKQVLQEKPKVVSEDRPVIRNRLPNQVDLSALEIKKAVTEEPMIRCPHCGQSSKTIVHIDNKGYYLRKDINSKKRKEEFSIITELETEKDIDNICKPEKASITDYHEDITKIKIPSKLKGLDINVDNDTVLECPICRETHKFSEWADAFENPIDYGFETDILCEVCGGEAVKTIKKDKTEEIKCERCGFIKKVI